MSKTAETKDLVEADADLFLDLFRQISKRFRAVNMDPPVLSLTHGDFERLKLSLARALGARLDESAIRGSESIQICGVTVRREEAASVIAEQRGKRLTEEERALRAALCPVCGKNARNSVIDGGFADGMLVGSGYRASRCANGHNWESKGWGEPFVVVAPGPGEVIVWARDDG